MKSWDNLLWFGAWGNGNSDVWIVIVGREVGHVG